MFGISLDLEGIQTGKEKSHVQGRSGDGKIFVFKVESALRVRTGEQGKDAL
ncbi:MAG: hypothetical protein HY788_05985 [Deltaproteobacteria bacterium]|nr:hypothetical protein [Deltaproteobacteria bacterium]